MDDTVDLRGELGKLPGRLKLSGPPGARILWGKTTEEISRGDLTAIEIWTFDRSVAETYSAASGKTLACVEANRMPGGGLIIPAGQWAKAYRSGGQWLVELQEDFAFLEGNYGGLQAIDPGDYATVTPLYDGTAWADLDQVINPFAGTILANDGRAGEDHYCTIHWSAAKSRWHFVSCECRYAVAVA